MPEFFDILAVKIGEVAEWSNALVLNLIELHSRKIMLQTLSNSEKPVKWQPRAKPERERVETRREWPKSFKDMVEV
jgi:hypothetical protein